MEGVSRSETIKLVSTVVRDAEACLSCCRSTDFGEHGLNEAGFKAVILSSCQRLVCDKGWSIFSEEPIMTFDNNERFVDILLVHEQDKVMILLELKYISAFWLEHHEPHRNIKDSRQREALDNTVAHIEALYKQNPRNLLLQRVRHPKLKRNVLSAYFIGEALDQVSWYARSVKVTSPTFMIVAVSIVGICNKIIVRVLKESLIPDEKDLEKYKFELQMNLMQLQQQQQQQQQQEQELQHMTLLQQQSQYMVLLQQQQQLMPMYPSETKQIRKQGCFRCGRLSHWANECYAKTHVDGRRLK